MIPREEWELILLLLIMLTTLNLMSPYLERMGTPSGYVPLGTTASGIITLVVFLLIMYRRRVRKAVKDGGKG